MHSKGNKLPFFENAKEARECYAREIGNALRSEIAATGRSAKDIMRWTRASERAVKGWISGKRGPSGEHLIPLMACYPADGMFRRRLCRGPQGHGTGAIVPE